MLTIMVRNTWRFIRGIITVRLHSRHRGLCVHPVTECGIKSVELRDTRDSRHDWVTRVSFGGPDHKGAP